MSARCKSTNNLRHKKHSDNRSNFIVSWSIARVSPCLGQGSAGPHARIYTNIRTYACGAARPPRMNVLHACMWSCTPSANQCAARMLICTSQKSRQQHLCTPDNQHQEVSRALATIRSVTRCRPTTIMDYLACRAQALKATAPQMCLFGAERCPKVGVGTCEETASRWCESLSISRLRE